MTGFDGAFDGPVPTSRLCLREAPYRTRAQSLLSGAGYALTSALALSWIYTLNLLPHAPAASAGPAAAASTAPPPPLMSRLITQFWVPPFRIPNDPEQRLTMLRVRVMWARKLYLWAVPGLAAMCWFGKALRRCGLHEPYRRLMLLTRPPAEPGAASRTKRISWHERVEQRNVIWGKVRDIPGDEGAAIQESRRGDEHV